MGTLCSSDSTISDDCVLPALERNLAQKKYGKYVGNLPPGYREATLKALIVTEKRKGRPVHMTEIYSVFEEISNFPKGMPLMVL